MDERGKEEKSDRKGEISRIRERLREKMKTSNTLHKKIRKEKR